MRRGRAIAGGLLVAGALAVGLLPGPADAATLTQAGWWWRVNDPTPLGTLPALPLAPEGGLVVGGAPDGATAIAALHFDLDAGEGAPILTLAVAEAGDQGGERAVLAACLTGSAWQPEQGGAWTNKPFPACEQGSVTGVRSEDGSTWTFALAPLVSDGILDVTLVPGLDPDLPTGANGSTFQLTFAAPTSASLATTAGLAEPPPIDLPDPGAGLPDTGGFAAPEVDTGAFALAPAASSFAPALPAADQGMTATAPVAQERHAPLAAPPTAAVAEHRWLAAAILVLCGAALLWSARLPTPPLRRLGGFAGANE